MHAPGRMCACVHVRVCAQLLARRECRGFHACLQQRTGTPSTPKDGKDGKDAAKDKDDASPVLEDHLFALANRLHCTIEHPLAIKPDYRRLTGTHTHTRACMHATMATMGRVGRVVCVVLRGRRGIGGTARLDEGNGALHHYIAGMT